ncbi:putative RNA-directed DNA polymerase [Tanacetum coccineum]
MSLWHNRLCHINKTRITKLQADGILEAFDHGSDVEYESCLMGKMTKAPLTVENQLSKKIKVLRSDRGGEYLSQEFRDHLRSCGIISQLSPPGTPQHNGVAERRNRTLLDMVRSRMSRATLLISFWGYALETAARILNLVPTKKGCEAYVRRETQDKLEPRSEKVVFIGYPATSYGYIFYKSSENKVFVSREAVFLERNMLSKEDSGSGVDLEEIQDSTEPIINTSESPSNETEETDIVPPLPRKSGRVRHEPERYDFYVSRSDEQLVVQDEPTTYQEAIASPESARWKESMESEMQSMQNNQARLVAKGFTQTHGVDYEETFSPVAMIKSIRILLAIIAFYDYEIW